MSVAGVISTFQSGTYTVTRRPAATLTNGRAVPGTPSTFSIAASVVPFTGRDLQVGFEAWWGEEKRILFTETALRTEDENGAADRVSIDGLTWLVRNVKRWPSYFEAIVSKPGVP